MSERHLLISSRRGAFTLEVTHGADRVELVTFETVSDIRSVARMIAAQTHLPIVDRSGVE